MGHKHSPDCLFVVQLLPTENNPAATKAKELEDTLSSYSSQRPNAGLQLRHAISTLAEGKKLLEKYAIAQSAARLVGLRINNRSSITESLEPTF
jgi:hypothetical protein